MRRSVMDAFIAARTGLGERLAPGGLLDWQLERLRALVAELAHASAFFRERLQGVNPAGLTTLAGLSAIPFTTAEELRGDAGVSFVRLPQREIRRIVSARTSGTSGEPKRIYFGEAELEATMDFYAHGMAEMMGPGDRALILMGGAGAGGMGDLLSEGIAALGGTAFFHGPVRDEAAAVKLLQTERPHCIIGLPAQIFRLARLAPQMRPKTVLLSGDYLPLAVRRAVEETWQCEVFDHYGLTETGYGCAVECSAHFGYHLREADLLVEIIDPESGRSLPDGETGEVVITTLGLRAMPLLRYRTGDRARILPGPCPCGSLLRRLGRIEGRIAGGGPISINELDEILFSFPALLGYEARLSGGKLHIEAEPLPSDPAVWDALYGFLSERLRVPFVLEVPGAFEKTSVPVKRALRLR